MTTLTQFHQLCERARTATDQTMCDEFMSLVIEIGTQWHDNATDALIERAGLLSQIAKLREAQFVAAENYESQLSSQTAPRSRA